MDLDDYIWYIIGDGCYIATELHGKVGATVHPVTINEVVWRLMALQLLEMTPDRKIKSGRLVPLLFVA